MQKKKGYDTIGVEVGDLIYHEFTNSYGWVVEVGRPTMEILHADTQVEWMSGLRTWNYYSSVLEWKRNADKEKIAIANRKWLANKMQE